MKRRPTNVCLFKYVPLPVSKCPSLFVCLSTCLSVLLTAVLPGSMWDRLTAPPQSETVPCPFQIPQMRDRHYLDGGGGKVLRITSCQRIKTLYMY